MMCFLAFLCVEILPIYMLSPLNPGEHWCRGLDMFLSIGGSFLFAAIVMCIFNFIQPLQKIPTGLVCVVNFDMPFSIETYVNQIGRTGIPVFAF